MAHVLITSLREFPAIEELLQHPELCDAVASVPRPLAAEQIKNAVAEAKEQLASRGELPLRELLADIQSRLTLLARREIRRVINATGIAVHTNLGRAPLSENLVDAIKETITGYGNVEFDLNSGKRGARGEAAEDYLRLVAGAEAATVVNNCAAALFVILNTFANRKSVIVSRGELVQIGGGFRIPDILRRAGARLREVGTTNITTVSDYEAAIDGTTALILKVHRSNFAQAGFTEEVDLKTLAALGARHDLPVVNDLGSGVLVPTGDLLGYDEPSVQQSVKDGAALTCFSGDKLLGGCQAGLIVGSPALVARVKRNPLFRTIRVDKIVFALLEHVLRAYLDGTWADEIQLWSMFGVTESELYRRGKQLLAELGNPAGLSVEATTVYVGGGALPESRIPSVAVVFDPAHRPERLNRYFRNRPTPIVGRIEADRFLLDLKAISLSDIGEIKEAIAAFLALQQTP